MSIRLSKSVLGGQEADAVAQVIQRGYLGMGRETGLFEEELTAYLGLEADRVLLCVASGTAALHLALEALDVGPGDEVVLPSLTFVSSFQAVAATGARAVACDVRLTDGNLDPEDLRRRIGPKTVAVMPVHYASSPGALDEVYDIAGSHGIRVVEDAAHAFGCRPGGTLVGTRGDVVCFSFDGIKNITSGEGGAVVTADPQVSSRVKDARLLGVERDTERRLSGERSWQPSVTRRGFRYHMSDLMAAIGRVQLRRLDGEFGPRRTALAKRYRALVDGWAGIGLFSAPPEGTVPHIFPVRILGGRRDEVRGFLERAGCGTGFHYAPNHLLDLFRTPYPLPVSEQLGRELISLPLHPGLSDEEQDWIVKTIGAALGGRGQ